VKTKIQKEYVDTGFGFPVRLHHVPMAWVRGAWTPKINYAHLARAVLGQLCTKGSRLTGNEVRFIRQHFELTLHAFADRFDVTHVAVLKWEKSGSAPIAARWAVEKDIRLFVLESLRSSSAAFVHLYGSLSAPPRGTAKILSLDARELIAKPAISKQQLEIQWAQVLGVGMKGPNAMRKHMGPEAGADRVLKVAAGR
jgi:hypothetical protein